MEFKFLWKIKRIIMNFHSRTKKKKHVLDTIWQRIWFRYAETSEGGGLVYRETRRPFAFNHTNTEWDTWAWSYKQPQDCAQKNSLGTWINKQFLFKRTISINLSTSNKQFWTTSARTIIFFYLDHFFRFLRLGLRDEQTHTHTHTQTLLKMKTNNTILKLKTWATPNPCDSPSCFWGGGARGGGGGKPKL